MVTTIQLIDYFKSGNWKYLVTEGPITESLLYPQLERKQVLIRNLVQILSEFYIFIYLFFISLSPELLQVLGPLEQ